MAPFELVTGRPALLPSVVLPPLPDLPAQPTSEEEDAYYAKVADRMARLSTLASARIKEMEANVRAATRPREGQ